MTRPVGNGIAPVSHPLTYDEKPDLSEKFVGNYVLQPRNTKGFMFSNRHFLLRER